MAKATRAQETLDRGLELIEALPYKTSLRWVFYALYQEGYYAGKDKKGAYKAWKSLCARYRKQQKRGWHPTTLADDTRARIDRTGGWESVDQALRSLIDDTVAGVDFGLDHFYQQERYVEIWFEAKAMSGQFKYHTRGVDLLPFGGDPSIPFKYSIAQHLNEAQNRYGKEVVVLYFGDYDPKGLQILESAVSDISRWSPAVFEVVRCGLTPEQIEHYNVPDNPDKPGNYQWEALPKEGAQEIIENSLSKYLDVDLVNTIDDEGYSQEEYWKEKIQEAMERLVKGEGS